MKKVLLTGGAGYIGQYIAKLLRQKGDMVTITSRSKEKTVQGLENRYMELLDTETIDNICVGMNTVIHLANYDERLIKEHPKEAFLANAYATREIYRDAMKNGVKNFIYLSTFHVYGLSSGEIDEGTPPQPKTDYGLSHYFAEEYLRQLSANSSCKVAVIRLTNGIGLPLGGVKKWYLVVNDFCRTVFYDQKIIMKSNGLPIRDFVALLDVAKAILLLDEKMNKQESKFDIYNLSSETTFSIRQMAYLVTRIYEQKYHQKVDIDLPATTEAEEKAVKPLMVYSKKIRAMGWKQETTVEQVIEEIFKGLEREI